VIEGQKIITPQGHNYSRQGRERAKYITRAQVRPGRFMRWYNENMDHHKLADLLSDLPLGSLRYFDRLGSTNDLAAQWAADGASDLSLIVADEQTAGRGRLNRRWFTQPRSSIAFSLILKDQRRISTQSLNSVSHYTGLGALAMCDALNEVLPDHHRAQIKWPNDVLAGERKIAGVLTEAHWQGDQLTAIILGIGINIAPDSVPPPQELNFPATCVEELLEKPINRWMLLHAVLGKLIQWRSYLGSSKFIQAWEGRLAYRGEWVRIISPDGITPADGQVMGINENGSLRLRSRLNHIYTISVGEIHLRPVDLSEKSTKLGAK
jgi:BirA family biotin operon repressor/biotin-[acetyl-CoA-carboxylase] ligase